MLEVDDKLNKKNLVDGKNIKFKENIGIFKAQNIIIN